MPEFWSYENRKCIEWLLKNAGDDFSLCEKVITAFFFFSVRTVYKV